jgi:hypothetical protein
MNLDSNQASSWSSSILQSFIVAYSAFCPIPVTRFPFSDYFTVFFRFYVLQN